MLRLPAACIILILAAASLPAQGVTVQSRILDLDISRFPTVELQVSVTKTGSAAKLTINNVQLDENGIPQRVEYFDCPEDSIRLSVAILLDRSASMAQVNTRPDRDSTKMREAKKAISTFLDLLGSRDESALFSFTTQNFTLRNLFTVEHDFTFDAQAVKRSLVPISANGGTRLWESIIDAVKLLENRGGRRVLIVLTDGRNQFGESYHSPAIQAAKSAGIPVYTIGLGSDADIGALSGFAAATGGRFYFAPEANALTEVFNEIAGALITDACILRYTSSNPCLDGSRRNIELTLSGSGFSSAADSFYSVPLQLNPVSLEIQSGLGAIARDTISIPIMVAEQFSIVAPLTYYMSVRYDNNLMHYIRAVSDGTMSQGSNVSVAEPSPGLLEISNVDFSPFLPTGTLCELVFVCTARGADTLASVEIVDADVRSFCPTALTAKSGSVSISACEDIYVVGDSAQFRLPGNGGVVRIPLRMHTSSPAGTTIAATLRIDYRGLPYEIIGVETEGTLGSAGGVIMQHPELGIAEFTVQAASSAGDSILFYVNVRVREVQRASVATHLPISEILIHGDCRVLLTEVPGGDWSEILIDGICEPILRRRTSNVVTNHPNPFSPETRVVFETRSEGPALLQVMDEGGRIVATLLDAWLRKGEYEHRFDASGLPAGQYYAVLSTEAGQTVRRMLLVK
ncbi:MAG: VWA domain-containing protein [Bacteroidetes bacterium]|nr:VWA domain-containing protein [Bacteroidota bacterium]